MTQLYRLKEKKTNTLSLEPVVMRESFPRQVDRESRGPQGERGLELSRRKKGQTFFLLYIPQARYILVKTRSTPVINILR